MVGGESMIPEFSRVENKVGMKIPKESALHKYKWIVGTRVNGYDWCETFSDALRYWLWHCGVPAKIAFGWFKRKRHEQD